MASQRWPNGSTRAWRKLRAQVLERDGHRCTHTWAGGRRRCTATTRLEVDHQEGGDVLLVPLRKLKTKCRRHHMKSFVNRRYHAAAA